MRWVLALMVVAACGGDDGSASGGSCSPANCGGCCMGDICEQGTTTATCGMGGVTCDVCDTATEACVASACTLVDPPLGVTWQQVTAAAAFGGRVGFAYTVHAGEMWILGGVINGGSSLADVWHSANGTTWTAATGSAAFGPAYAGCLVSFNSALWFIGLNGIWTSTDGAGWTHAVVTNPFPTSTGSPGANSPHCVVWNGQIWLAGSNAGNVPQVVWSSPDGTTWTMASAGYAANGFTEGLAALSNKLYAFNTNGVYASTDGMTWTPATLSFHAVGPAVTARGAMWARAGAMPSVLYSSTDGATWTSVLSAPPWEDGNTPTGGQGNGYRTLYGMFAFDPAHGTKEKLWVAAGSEPMKYDADVWVSPP